MELATVMSNGSVSKIKYYYLQLLSYYYYKLYYVREGDIARYMDDYVI